MKTNQILCVGLVLLLLVVAGCSEARRTSEEIIQAFHSDGFGILSNVTLASGTTTRRLRFAFLNPFSFLLLLLLFSFLLLLLLLLLFFFFSSSSLFSSGARGFMAYSYNSTTRSTGLPKRAYYVEGTSYEMGFLIGLLDEPSVAPLTYDYVNKFFPALIVPDLAQKLANTSWWESFEVILGSFLVEKSSDQFYSHQHLFPSYFAQEMQGVADGAKSANPNTLVTYPRVVALSYVLDFVLAHAYSGNLFEDMMKFVAERLPMTEFAELSWLMEQQIQSGQPVLQLPVWCEAFGGGGFLARDFQLVTADIFQDYQVRVCCCVCVCPCVCLDLTFCVALPFASSSAL